MERETVFRDAAEFRGSGAVRRLIDRVGKQLAGACDNGRVSSRADDRWQDVFWFGERQALSEPESRPAFQGGQGLLPYEEPQGGAGPRSASTMRGRLGVFLHAGGFADDAPRLSDPPRCSTMRQAPAAKPVYAERGQTIRKLDIAKFLQVNRAVHGVEGGSGRFALPSRGFAAQFQLWKGSESETPFLMGC